MRSLFADRAFQAGAAHMLNTDQPGAFNPAVLAFLADQAAVPHRR
jgi:dihydropteroate synthase